MAKRRIAYPMLCQPAVVKFGTGSIRELADDWAERPTAVFISGSTRVRDVVETALDRGGCSLGSVKCHVKPPGEPTVAMVRAGSEFLKEGAYERLIAIGGGSVMDWCRLSWAESSSEICYETGKIKTDLIDGRRPEIWLIPTTCGSGAEAAAVAVLSNGGRKVPVVSPAFVADRVVLDGRFLHNLEPHQLACYLCDALSHAIEGWLSIVPNYLAKEAGMGALKLILDYFDHEPAPSRFERFMDAGYLGGVAASHCSVGVVHAFSHTVARYGVSHGLGNALALRAGIRLNSDTDPMASLLQRVGLPDADSLIAAITPIVNQALAANHESQAVGDSLKPNNRDAVCEGILADNCLRTNPKSLSREDVERLLDEVGGGIKTR